VQHGDFAPGPRGPLPHPFALLGPRRRRRHVVASLPFGVCAELKGGGECFFFLTAWLIGKVGRGTGSGGQQEQSLAGLGKARSCSPRSVAAANGRR
jgi:hypothetical protein